MFSSRLRSIFMIVGPATYSLPSRFLLLVTVAVCLGCGMVHPIAAQTPDAFSDSGADPVKLFEQGQNAHSRGLLVKAVEYYDEALKVKPEFPEAQFQRAHALTALGNFAEAETGFRRAIELRKNWSLPYSSLGALLIRLNREKEAETYLREAIRLDPQDRFAIQTLAGARLNQNDPKEALELATQATIQSDASAAIWFVRALAERRLADNKAALISLNRVLESEPQNFEALMERADLHISERQSALEDLKAAEALSGADKKQLARLAAAYERAGNAADAQRVANAAGLHETTGTKTGDVIGTAEEIKLANSDDPVQSRDGLEKLLKKNSDNAKLLARLGASYRTVDPARSLVFYRRALDLDPTNAELATGYGAALIQARRFGDAALVLKKVVAAAPNSYAAHANLATALYELKQFPEALVQYEWLLRSKPDLTVAHYFIATAHDNLGEYKQALASYDTFLAQADPVKNRLEIDKVKLRLPTLRRQIQRGEGTKQKSVQNRKP